MEDTEFQTGELVLIEIPIYSFLLKHQKSIYMGTKQWQQTSKREIIPQDYHRRLFALFLSEMRRSRSTLPQNWPRHQRVRASRDYWLRWPSSARVEKPSNCDSPPPSTCLHGGFTYLFINSSLFYLKSD